jgi:hypothetical protein
MRQPSNRSSAVWVLRVQRHSHLDAVSRLLRSGLCLFALLASSAAGLASAQSHPSGQGGAKVDKAKQEPPPPPRAALLSTSGSAASGTPLDSVLHASLEELKVVRIVARPGMDLGAVQLALDCVGETAPCLKAVAAQNDAQVLIAPTLQRTSTELVLSILRFDSRGDGSVRRVLRRQSGKVLGDELLDAVPSMLRELFDLPKLEPKAVASAEPEPRRVAEAPAPEAATALPEGPMEPPSASRRVPIGPLVLGGAGVVVLGVGGVMGLVMQSTQSDYDSARIETKAQADMAAQTRSTGETQAVIADVMFAVGGAALIAGGIWLAVELTNKPSYESEPTASTTQLTPLLGPHQVGLMWTHRGGAL